MHNCLRSIAAQRSVSTCHGHQDTYHHLRQIQDECYTLGRANFSICTLTTDEKIARLEQMLECQRAEVAALEAKIAVLTKEKTDTESGV